MNKKTEGSWWTTPEGFLAEECQDDTRPALPFPMFYTGVDSTTSAMVRPVAEFGPQYAAYAARIVLRSTWAGEQLRLAAARELRRAVRAAA